MQVIFYMSPSEEAQFFEHLFSCGAYCLPGHWPVHPTPALRTVPEFVQDRTSRFRELMIFKEDLFACKTASKPAWAQFWRPGNVYTNQTLPGIQYTRPCRSEAQLYPGRLYFSASISSFQPLNADRSGGIAEADKKSYAALQRFYKSSAAYLRRALQKHMRSWYIGGEVEDYCQSHGLTLASSTHAS
jgi:hypothetical protein